MSGGDPTTPPHDPNGKAERTLWFDRATLAPCALGLAAYAGLAAYGVTRLPHTGAWTLLLVSAILAAAAVGLLARQLWSLLFGALFWSTTALGYAALGAVVGWQGLTNTTGGEWAGVRSLVLGGVGVVALAVAALSFMLGSTLAIPWRAVTARRSAAAWLSSMAGAVMAMLLLAWLLGAQLWQRQLFAQNECLSGNGARCQQLANDAGRFSIAERRAFALRGCESGTDLACGLVVAFMDAALDRTSAEARAVEARCQAGKADLCQRLGVHLLQIGDREGGAHFLEQTCATDVRWCDSAAEAAQKQRALDVARRLRERGCERDDARACRGLLRQLQASLPPDELARLELKTCLVGDVNDCRPLILRDLRGVCPQICAGATENLFHTCGHCAQEAVKAGDAEIARVWLTSTCSRGYSWSCRDLQQLPQTERRRRPAQVTQD